MRPEQEPASANSAEWPRWEQPRGPNKISALTKYSFTGRNLTAYGGQPPLAESANKIVTYARPDQSNHNLTTTYLFNR